MKKWNGKLALLLVLVFSIGILGGCSTEESFAPRKAPDEINQKFYDDMMAVISDASKIKDDFDEKFSIYDSDSDECYNELLAWHDDLFDHKLLKQYIGKEESLNESEIELFQQTRYLYNTTLLFHFEAGVNLREDVIEHAREQVNSHIKEMKEIIDIDIDEEDFIKK